MSLKRQRSESPTSGTTTDPTHDYWTSPKIEDRASIFQAYFSPTMPAKQLQNLEEIKSASHRILAWRSPGTQRTLVAKVRTLETGTDDDGERYGGRTVLKVLEQMRVEGAVVVARWYGGQMLGPARFAHMESCARDAIGAWRQKEDGEGQKRRRVEDEDMERVGLIVELEGRDQNIKVLRDLLQQKTKKASAVEEKMPARPVVAAKVDYHSMDLERLRQLDKARDSTVAFLLKKIDEAEKEVGSSNTDTKAESDQPQVAVEVSKPLDLGTDEPSPKHTGLQDTATDVKAKSDEDGKPEDVPQAPQAVDDPPDGTRNGNSEDLLESAADTKAST